MRVLHISDLHCGSEPEPNQDLMVKAMFEDVTNLSADCPIDLVVFSGDLAARGKPDEFLRARGLLLEPLASKLGLQPDQIVLVPGNHDINRDLISEFLEPGLKLLRTGEEVNRLIGQPSDFEHATTRVQAWRTFHDQYYASSMPTAPNALSWVHRFTIEGHSVGVAVLDSSWRATGAANDLDKHLLIVGETQAGEALDLIDDCTVRIVTFHHPLGWLAAWNHASLRDEVEHRGALVLTGHEHVADPVMERSIRGSAIYSRAGCLYQGKTFPNGYTVIDIDVRDRKVIMRLRGWMSARRVFDAATDVVEGGSVEFALPDRVGRGLITLPKYTTVVSTLASLAQSNNLFSGQLAPEDISTVDEVIVEPRLYRAPYGQIAAAVGLVKSMNKRIDNMRAVNPLVALDESRILVLTGDAESGVTYSLLWVLQQQYSRDAGRVPVYLRYETHAGRDPFEKDVRAAARFMTLEAGPQDELPPLIVAFDDVAGENERALHRLAGHIKSHPNNLYILGCHGDSFRDILQALEAEGVNAPVAFVGPFGRRQTIQLMELAGLSGISDDVNRVLKVVFDENLPRSPFVLAALVAVLARAPESKPPNVSTLLDAVVDLLMGKSDPSDQEAGMDSRDREHILEVLAGHFTRTETGRLARADAEEYLDDYFKSRGIERSVSPGHVLDSLLRRKVLIEDVDGVGFRHATLQHVLSAKLMLEDGAFNDDMRNQPVRYSDIIRHAAALRRTDKGLLDLVGKATAAPMARILKEGDGLFDRLLGADAVALDAEDLDRRIEAVGPKPIEERERDLDEYYEHLEMVESLPSGWDKLPFHIIEAVHGTAYLSFVLSGSELVDDVDMKTAYLKQALMSWGAIAGVLGARTSDWDILRDFCEDIFPELDDPHREVFWALFVRVSVILSTAVTMSGVIGSAGLGTAIRRLADDEEIMSSPTYSLYLTILFVELNLDGYIEQLSGTFSRHHRHMFLVDVTRMVALSRYMSPRTSERDAQKLLMFLADAMGRGQTGRHGVEQRSRSKSEVIEHLRRERARHRDDLIGESLVDDLLGLEQKDV